MKLKRIWMNNKIWVCWIYCDVSIRKLRIKNVKLMAKTSTHNVAFILWYYKVYVWKLRVADKVIIEKGNEVNKLRIVNIIRWLLLLLLCGSFLPFMFFKLIYYRFLLTLKRVKNYIPISRRVRGNNWF